MIKVCAAGEVKFLCPIMRLLGQNLLPHYFLKRQLFHEWKINTFAYFYGFILSRWFRPNEESLWH